MVIKGPQQWRVILGNREMAYICWSNFYLLFLCPATYYIILDREHVTYTKLSPRRGIICKLYLRLIKRPSRGLAIKERAEVTYSSAKEYIFEQGIKLESMFWTVYGSGIRYLTGRIIPLVYLSVTSLLAHLCVEKVSYLWLKNCRQGETLIMKANIILGRSAVEEAWAP